MSDVMVYRLVIEDKKKYAEIIPFRKGILVEFIKEEEIKKLIPVLELSKVKKWITILKLATKEDTKQKVKQYLEYIRYKSEIHSLNLDSNFNLITIEKAEELIVDYWKSRGKMLDVAQ